MPGMNETDYRTQLAQQAAVTSAMGGMNNLRPPQPQETILSITEDSVKAMEELNSVLHQISLRLAGSIPQIASTLMDKDQPEPTMQRRAQFLRGLIHQALAHAQRIDSNL